MINKKTIYLKKLLPCKIHYNLFKNMKKRTLNLKNTQKNSTSHFVDHSNLNSTGMDQSRQKRRLPSPVHHQPSAH